MKNKHLLYILLFLNSIILAKAQSNCVNTPSVSVNLTGLCAGKSELLTATPTNGGSTPFYTWKLNNAILPIFTNKTTEAGLSDNTINEVYVIGSNIYAATSIGLNISTNSGSTFTNRTKASNGLGNDLVNGLFVTATKIYAATAGGLSISDNNGTTFTNRTTANGLGSNIVNDVFVDGTNVYAATASGLSISIDGGASFTNKSMNSVRGVFVDGNNIYAATSAGLNVSTDAGANFILKTTVNGLGNNNINDVYKVGTRIYLATSGGLSISSDNGNSFINKTTANGLGNNNVSSVFAIGSFIYASTVGGLSLSNDNGTNFFINKTTTDGLGTNTLNDAFALGNNIYAATTGGLAIATINTLQVNDVKANDVYTVTMLPSTADCPTATATVSIYPLPIPNITTNSPVCTAMPLTLNATNERVNTGNTYSWAGPNAYTSTNQNLSFSATTVTLSGTYSVTVTDANGCTATTSKAATVNPLPIPTIGSNSPICTGFTLNLTSSNSRNTFGNSYAWTGPNTYTSANQNPFITNANTSMSGTYSVTITDANGCTATATTSTTVNPLPTPSVSNNSPICTGFTLNLTATNTRNVTGNSYSWTGPNAYASTIQNPSFTNATTALSGTYSVTITDLNGCTATATTSVTVNPLPIPSVSNNSPICTGFTLNLTATNTRNVTGNSYSWMGPNAYASTIQNPSFTNATTALSGTYSVTITDLNGCTATATTSVTVNPLPIPSVSNNSPICTGFTLNLTATNTRNETGNSYSWTGPNAYASTIQNPSFTNATTALSGTYSVTITDANGCTATATTSVTVNPLPIPSVSNNSPICTGFTLNLAATNTRNETGNAYSWTGPNAYASTIQNPSFTNATTALSGTYSVTITDANGCTATATTSVTVNPLPIPSVSNNSPICTGFTLNLTAENTRNTTGNAYSWTGPNSYASTIQNPSFTNATTALSGTYSVTITDANGCTATATTSVTVNPLPIPSVSNNSPICTGFTLNLTAENIRNATGNAYSWTGPNSYASTIQNPSFTNATTALSGTYSVTITDANGCTATATTSITVNPLPIPSVSNNSPICAEFGLTLNATNTRNETGNAYMWTGPNAYSSTIQNPSFANATTALSGTYSVTITDANGCTATATTNVIVKPKPPVPVISVPSQLVVCFPNTLTLTANGCTGTVTWSNNSTGSNITLSTIGTYSLSAICTIDGCVSESSSLITGLEIKVAPTAQASNNGPYIVGQTIKLTASNGPNYSWTGPNNFTSLVSSPTITNATLQNSGIYSVTVSINGCTATATTNVIVNNFAPCSPQRIVDYSYVKAGNPHQPLFPLSNGMVLQQIPEQSSILVTPVCPTINIESFEMKIVGPELNYLTVQNVSYFALFSNEEEDVFGRNFTPGDYTLTVTGYSQDDKNGAVVYGPIVTTFKVVGTLGTISMPTISSQSICAGSSIDVSFSTSGNFNQVSQFQVQLSDANGSFQNPTTIGTSNTTGTVSCFIPANIAEGTNYLIRVASANQTAVGNPTMSAVTVNPLNSNISQNISTGTVTNKATQTLSATNKIIAPANVSYQAGKAISLNAGFEAGSGSIFKAEIKGCN
ncbi:hypothetical protein GCM10011514_18830 [Emticicia aquatilis]|uniref:Ig-like domain-containing protein n=1 Tax=Emticicia aquatilis TaxID=1537369 RepID=A0A916YQS7_9BACT|nr:3-coathanger stack domain-containing protein [Emticicia aquatilis]GGD54886.1 hypothetical protein GCM10011514_18830 [Emticicia aquatilis]